MKVVTRPTLPVMSSCCSALREAPGLLERCGASVSLLQGAGEGRCTFYTLFYAVLHKI